MEQHNLPTKDLPPIFSHVVCDGEEFHLDLIVPTILQLPSEWKQALSRIRTNKPPGRRAKIQHESVKRLQQITLLLNKSQTAISVDDGLKVLGHDLAIAWYESDEKYFDDLIKAFRAKKQDERRKQDELEGKGSVSCGLIKAAIMAFAVHSRNPTREEVKALGDFYGVPPKREDWSKLFLRCDLDFLKGKPKGKACKTQKRTHCANE